MTAKKHDDGPHHKPHHAATHHPKPHEAEVPEPAPAHEEAASAAKFKVGDEVSVRDAGSGEVVEVTPHREKLSDGSLGFLYTVRLAPWKRVETAYTDTQGESKVKVHFEHPETGAVRGHEADTLGCVEESRLSAGGHSS